MSGNKKRIELHPEFIKFCEVSDKEINKKNIQNNKEPLIIHYLGDAKNFGFPEINQVIAFEYYSGDIKYRLNNKNYKEKDMLRMIKLKSFM